MAVLVDLYEEANDNLALVFKNEGPEVVFLVQETVKATQGELIGDNFAFTGEQSRYTGPMIKRLPYKWHELMPLDLGEEFASGLISMAILDYTWQPGAKIHYRRAQPLEGLDQPWTTITSNQISLGDM